MTKKLDLKNLRRSAVVALDCHQQMECDPRTIIALLDRLEDAEMPLCPACDIPLQRPICMECAADMALAPGKRFRIL